VCRFILGIGLVRDVVLTKRCGNASKK